MTDRAPAPADVEAIAEVLAAHRLYVHCSGDDWNEPAEEDAYCTCDREGELGGWVHTAENHEPPDWDRLHAAHVVEALLASPALATLRAHEQAEASGEDHYREFGWSGCAGSAWDNLPDGAKAGWEHAARVAAGANLRHSTAQAKLADRISRHELERALRAADAPEDSMATQEDLLRWEGRAEAVEIVRDMLGLRDRADRQEPQ